MTRTDAILPRSVRAHTLAEQERIEYLEKKILSARMRSWADLMREHIARKKSLGEIHTIRAIANWASHGVSKQLRGH